MLLKLVLYITKKFNHFISTLWLTNKHGQKNLHLVIGSYIHLHYNVLARPDNQIQRLSTNQSLERQLISIISPIFSGDQSIGEATSWSLQHIL